MTSPSLEALAEEIRNIYSAHPDDGQSHIKMFLEKNLGDLSTKEKVASVEKLAGVFQADDAGNRAVGNEEVLSRVCSLLLGRKVSSADSSSSELLERLAESLNTIFDTLNQLVSLIHTTLRGGGTGEETIRQVIGVHLQGEDQTESLESYLGEIKKAFWVAQEAFRKAANTKVEQVLAELDPNQLQGGQGKGFKFGPMRKAESFQMFEEKYGKVKRWFDSGKFGEEFMREFEKNAQKLTSH
jgi:hypothetical protein